MNEGASGEVGEEGRREAQHKWIARIDGFMDYSTAAVVNAFADDKPNFC